jgi:hypothetical protein
MPEGRLISVPLDTPEARTIWDPVPGLGNMGGMWGWGGVSVTESCAPHCFSAYRRHP